jgi:nucleoporin POM152
MNLSVNLGLSNPGDYSFQVTMVKDGCGNVIDLQGLVARNIRKPEIRHVHVRERPSVGLLCDPRRPIKIVNMGDTPSVDIELSINRGTAPFQIGYVYQKTDLDEPHPMKDIRVTKDDTKARITATKPGLYTLTHIKDAYCEGEIELPRDCSVTVATLPTVDIVSHPINDSCVGAIGVTVDATFTGEGPWEGCFDVWRNGRLQKKDVCHSSPKPRLNLELKPDLSGNFQYIFKTVSDKNYSPIKVNLPPILQNIHPQPSAVFVAGQTGLKTCRGSSEKLDVELFGTGPWDIEYRVIRGKTIQLYTQRDITEKTTTLALPPFEREGIYSIVSCFSVFLCCTFL